MQLDVTEAEDLMEEFLKNLMLIEGILTYTPTTLMSLFHGIHAKIPGGDGSRFHHWNAY